MSIEIIHLGSMNATLTRWLRLGLPLCTCALTSVFAFYYRFTASKSDKKVYKIKKNYYWVLLEHQIKYLSPAFLNDRIRLKTYIEKTEGVKSNRVVEIYNLNSNKLLVNSITTWCLVNAKTNKPNRIKDEIRQAFGK